MGSVAGSEIRPSSSKPNKTDKDGDHIHRRGPGLQRRLMILYSAHVRVQAVENILI